METKEQVLNAFRLELDKWLKHSVRGMKSGNTAYFQGKITLIHDLLGFIHDIDEEINEPRDPCGLRGPSGVDGDKDWYLLDQEIIDWCGKFRPSIREEIQSTAYHFADWQKEQMKKED